jgi:predicted metal-dependent phosphoesterase TrpH
LDEAAGTSLTLVPAVELSSSEGDRDIHILGYFIRHEDPHLLQLLADLRDARLERARAMVSLLGQAGFELDLNDVMALAQQGAIGRSHIARTLVAAGHAPSIAEAFDRFIGRGREFYVSKDVRSSADVIQTIRDAGGIAVAAHPGVSGIDDLFPELIRAGLGGIEAYHADHSPQQGAHFAQLAAENGLLVTGGSDYHGAGAPNPDLGSVDIPEDAVRSLLEWGRDNA